MFCNNCGKEGDSKFCQYCGEKFYTSDDLPNDIEQMTNELPEKSFWEKAVEQGNAINAKKALKKQEAKEHLKQMDRDGIAYCPKCHSVSLSANKKGFGVGKAVIGGLVGAAVALPLGAIGLTAGGIGSKKVKVTCLKCGHEFWAGKK